MPELQQYYSLYPLIRRHKIIPSVSLMRLLYIHTLFFTAIQQHNNDIFFFSEKLVWNAAEDFLFFCHTGARQQDDG